MNYINVLIFLLSHILLSEKVKGLKNENIIGGYQDKKFPYQVSILSDFTKCNGGIIGDQHVITSAHCIVNDDKQVQTNNMIVRGGVSSWEACKESKFKIEYKVLALYLLKKYFEKTGPSFYGDIAVLKVEKPFDFVNNPNLKALNMAPDNFNIVGQTAVVASFGIDRLNRRVFFDKNKKKQVDGYATRHIHYTNAKILSDRVSTLYWPDIWEDQFCAQVEQTGNDPKGMPDGMCYGDSGSPLVYKDELVGILCSGTDYCDERFSCSIYVNVTYHKTFIKYAKADYCDTSSMACYYL